MEKVDSQAEKVLEDIIQDKDQSFEFNGRMYKIAPIDNKDNVETTVAEDVEKYPDFKPVSLNILNTQANIIS